MQDYPIPPIIPPLPRINHPRQILLRSHRPSLIDLRFKGDPWVVEQDERASVCLGDFPLGSVVVSPLDVPSLNRFLLQVRIGQARRNSSRRMVRLAD